VGAIHVGVRHDDDAAVAQLGDVEALADAAAQRLDQVLQFLVAAQLLGAGEATLRILPRRGSTACVSRSRACLAEPPALSPSTRKISVPRAFRAQSVELAGQAQLARARLARRVLLGSRGGGVLGSLDRRRRAGCRQWLGRPAEPVVEGSRSAVLDAGAAARHWSGCLGLALKLRLADEHAEHRRHAA
jgi:hypothetical protein